MDLVGLLAFNVLTGIATLVLITLGLGVIYGMMRVINLAHGEFMMLGAYTAVIGYQCRRQYLDCDAGVATPFVGVVGLVLERDLIRFLYGRMIDTMLATWGVSLGLIGLMATIFGNVTRGCRRLSVAFQIGRYRREPVRPRHRRVRACRAGRHVGSAAIYEIRPDPPRHDAEPQHGGGARRIARRPTWPPSHSGAALAGLAGGVLAPISGVSPGMGGAYIAKAFITVLGGGPAIITGTGLAARCSA